VKKGRFTQKSDTLTFVKQTSAEVYPSCFTVLIASAGNKGFLTIIGTPSFQVSVITASIKQVSTWAYLSWISILIASARNEGSKRSIKTPLFHVDQTKMHIATPSTQVEGVFIVCPSIRRSKIY